jgi:hypothetical protein
MRKILKESAKILAEMKSETITKIILALIGIIVLGVIAALNVNSSIKIVLLFIAVFVIILLTVFYRLMISGLIRLLIWISDYKKPVKIAKLKFEMGSDNEQDFYLAVHNYEKWIDAKTVKIYWAGISANPNIGFDASFREINNWVRDMRTLEWRNNLGEKTDSINIPKRKMEKASLLKLNKDENKFIVLALGCDPICFSVGEYILHFRPIANLKNRLVNQWVEVSFEYKGGNKLKIDKVWSR